MKKKLINKSGEGYINTAVTIVIAVIIGGLLIGGLYALFSGENGMFNQLDVEVEEMFNTGKTIQLKKESNRLMYSYDGETWKLAQTNGISSGSHLEQISSITKNETTVWVTVYSDGLNDTVYSSLDGFNWTPIYVGEGIYMTRYTSSIGINYANGLSYATYDGINWILTSTKRY